MNILDSYESAVEYCKMFHPDVLNVRNNNDLEDFFGLDEEDIERIQEILAESDVEDNADDVEIWPDTENEFPMPKKLTRKELN